MRVLFEGQNMTKKERKRLSQRDEEGRLVYRIGQLGGTGEICDDMAKTKAPKNEAENACFMDLSALGWTATKRGWPDFFCVRNGEIMAVEVKPRKGHPLKANQAVIMVLLADHGIPCYLWTPDGGLERMNGTE